MNWLTQLLESTKELEPPRNFWLWSGLAAISATVKDNVWLDRGKIKGKIGEYYKLYPNIYVMLHADSGLKKGPPVSFAKNLVKKVNNTRIISGRSSIQGILKELGTGYTLPGGKVVNKSVAFIAASEFSSSLVSDPAAMDILTDLYDRQYNEGDWKSLLKMENFTLKDPTVTMLVATNEAHFDNFIEGKDKRGGFIGRMFVIAESEVNILNPLIDELDAAPDIETFAPYLKEVSKLVGPFQPLAGTGAGELYKKWYQEFYMNVKEQKVKDETGTIQRFGDSVLKVAMLLSLSQDLKLIITEDTMQEAISMSEKLVGNVRKTTIGKESKTNKWENHQAIVIKELLSRSNHMITRQAFNKKYWMHGLSGEWDEIMKSFADSGMVKIENVGNQILYRMPENIVEYFRRKLSGKIENEE